MPDKKNKEPESKELEGRFCLSCKSKVVPVNLGSQDDPIEMAMCPNEECDRFGLISAVSMKVRKEEKKED